MLYTLDIDIAVANELPLSVKFSVELSVLALAVVVDSTLLVDFRSERLDETNVRINTRLVIFVHSTFVLVETAKVLLQVHQLVLELLIVSLSCSQLRRFFHQLSDHTFLLSRLGCARGRDCGGISGGGHDLRHVVSRAVESFTITALRAVGPQRTVGTIVVVQGITLHLLFLHDCCCLSFSISYENFTFPKRN